MSPLATHHEPFFRAKGLMVSPFFEVQDIGLREPLAALAPSALTDRWAPDGFLVFQATERTANVLLGHVALVSEPSDGGIELPGPAVGVLGQVHQHPKLGGGPLATQLAAGVNDRLHGLEAHGSHRRAL